MNHFRTILPIQPAPFTIGYSDPSLLIGSCFTENIGNRLRSGKLPVLINPFGIVYNPVSIARCLEYLLSDHPVFGETGLFEHGGLWHSWEHHSHFSQPDKEATLTGLNAALTTAAAHLKKTTRLLLTLGTADVFTLRSTGQVVANNHKMPAALFESDRLSVAEVTDIIISVLEKIKMQNADIQVILTVSPVRHIRNGLVENQRSKATLLLACEQICEALPYACYFPAYELLLDDLRDYRFYADDLLHPSQVATDYIWQFLGDTFFSETTRRLYTRIDKIGAAMQHRPFHPETLEHQAFARAQLAAIEQLSVEHPYLDFSAEKAHFQTFFG